MRFRFWSQIAGLALLSVLTILIIDSQNLGAWSESPLSVAPGTSISPLSLAVERLSNWFDGPIQAFLWLWLAIGLVVFGGLALILIRLLGPTESVAE